MRDSKPDDCAARTQRILRAEPLASGGAEALPDELAPRRLLRRLLQVVGLLALLALVVLLAPGIDGVRRALASAAPGWLAVAVVLEALSCGSYVVMFRAVFCPPDVLADECGDRVVRAGRRLSRAGQRRWGLALGAWILHRGGMAADRIARRSVAFFLIKSSVNFVAVAVLGTLMASGLVGPHVSPLLTAPPAALSVAVIALVLAIPRLGPGAIPAPTPRGSAGPRSRRDEP